MKRIFLLISLVLSTSLLSAFTDDVGQEVDIQLPIDSVACLSPAHTEMIYWLGGEDKLAAVSTSCDYPPQTAGLKKAGTFLNPDIEKIVKLKPGAVISGGGIQKKAIMSLQKLGVPVAVYYPMNIDGIIEDMRSITMILGLGEEAEKKIQKFEKDFKKMKLKNIFHRKPKIYVELWDDPAMGVGSESFISEVLTLAGGRNILYDARSEYPKVSKEEIVKRNPDIVVLMYPGDEAAKNREDFKLTNAGKNGNVFALEQSQLDMLMRPGPRVLESIEIFRDIIEKSMKK